MRQLHPVSFHEKFVASGTYTFFKGDLPTGDVEYWTMHEPGNGSFTIRSDRDGRFGSGVSWLFEALYVFTDGSARIERFDVQILAPRETLAQFLFDERQVSLRIRHNGKGEEPRILNLPDGYVVMPPSAVAELLFVPRLVAAGRRSTPALLAGLDLIHGDVRGAYLETVEIFTRGAGTQEVSGAVHPALAFDVTGDRGTSIACWFDEHSVLLRYESASGQRVVLTEYVHRREPAS